MRQFAAAFAGLTLGLSASPVSGQELRSDSPLWTYETEPNEALFPRSFLDADSFGCVHAIPTGLYRWTGAEEAEPRYWSLDNYGVFHCALLFGTAHEPEETSDAFIDYAWIVKLGDVVENDGSETELMALQIGIRSGSQYILLRRRKGDREHLEQLAPECPPSAERRTATIDIWQQDVCVVASQDQLRSMARDAHRRPAAGRLDLIPAPAEDETTDEE